MISMLLLNLIWYFQSDKALWISLALHLGTLGDQMAFSIYVKLHQGLLQVARYL